MAEFAEKEAIKQQLAEKENELTKMKAGLVSYSAQMKQNFDKMQESITLEKRKSTKLERTLAKKENEFEKIKAGVKEFHTEMRKRLDASKKQLSQEVERRCLAEMQLKNGVSRVQHVTVSDWIRTESRSNPGQFYFRHRHTGKTRSSPPAGDPAATVAVQEKELQEKEMTDEGLWIRVESRSNPGQIYYRHRHTGKTCSSLPDKKDLSEKVLSAPPAAELKVDKANPSPWLHVESRNNPGKFYWKHKDSGQTRWSAPEEEEGAATAATEASATSPASEMPAKAEVEGGGGVLQAARCPKQWKGRKSNPKR
jgi:hypothetical protein